MRIINVVLLRGVLPLLCGTLLSFKTIAAGDSSSFINPQSYIPPVFTAVNLNPELAVGNTIKTIVKDFKLVKLNLNALNAFVKQYQYRFSRFYLELNGTRYLLELQTNDMRSTDYKSSVTSVSGTVTTSVDPFEEINTYKGFSDDNINNIVRLTISETELFGYIYIQATKQWLYIEPLKSVLQGSPLAASVDPNMLVIFHVKDVIMPPQIDTEGPQLNIEIPATQMSDPCIPLTLEIATDADYEFYFKYKKLSNQRILDYLNQVEGVYSANFNMVFSVTHQNVWEDVVSQPYKSSNVKQFCVDMNNVWSGETFASVRRDIVHAWSGKTFHDGYWGAVPEHGGIGSVCSSPSTSNGVTMDRDACVITTAHEIGHNFNARHCDGYCSGIQYNDKGVPCSDGSDGVNYRNSIMCRGEASLYFGDQERNVISSWINSHLSCLKNPNVQNVSGDWLHVWTNTRNQERTLGTWLMQPGDITLTGDFDGDKWEEFLFIDGVSKWSTLMHYNCGYGSDWYHEWSNMGNGMIGFWQRRPYDQYFTGDFDGDGKTDLFSVSPREDWALIQSYIADNFDYVLWSNQGNHTLANEWAINNSDHYVIGDFDGDKKDELLCFNENANKAYMFKLSGGAFSPIWHGDCKIADMALYASSTIRLGDFENKGYKELMLINGATAAFFRYNTVSGIWEKIYGVSNNMSGWILPQRSQDALITGNLDADPEEEYMFIQGGSDAQWATSFSMNSNAEPQWNWSNYGNGLIDDWHQIGATGDGSCWYYPIRNNPDYPCQLFAVTCLEKTMPNTHKKYWAYPASLYRSSKPDSYKRPAASGIDHNKRPDLSIMPNPAKGEVYVQISPFFKNEFSLYIYDLLGREVYTKEKNVNETERLDISNYLPGVYLVRLTNRKQESFISKLIIN